MKTWIWARGFPRADLQVDVFLINRTINRTYMNICLNLKGTNPTCIIVVIWVNFFQIEIMVEIYSKGLVRAIVKVLLMKFS